MFVVHVKTVVKEDAASAYEEWKRSESAMLAGREGFIKRTLLHSQENPQVYYYQAFWESSEQAKAFANSPEFAELRDRLKPAQGFAESMISEEGDLIFDDLAGPDVEADASNPWVIHVSVVVNDEPEAQQKYRTWKIKEGGPQTKSRGFIKRTLLQSKDRPTHFYYQSFWEAEELSHGFSFTQEFKDLFAQYSPVGVFAIPQVLEHCDVVIDEPAG